MDQSDPRSNASSSKKSRATKRRSEVAGSGNGNAEVDSPRGPVSRKRAAAPEDGAPGAGR